MKKLFTFHLLFLFSISYSQVKLKITPSMIIDEKAYPKTSAFNMFDEQAITGTTEPPSGVPVNRWGEYLDATIYYPIAAVIDLGQDITIGNMYLFDGSGSGKVEIYTGSQNNWTLAVTDNFTSYNAWNKQPINKTTRYLRVLNYDPGNNFLELVIFGNKQTLSPPNLSYTPNYPIMDEFMGVNIIHATSNPTDASVVKHLREFHEWSWDEANENISGYLGYPQNQYGFNPSWAGGWNFDQIYKSYKDKGNTIYPTLQSSAFWILGSTTNDSTQNKPTTPSENTENPQSYIEHADYMYQFAARYGSNKNIPTGTIKLKSDNTKLVGLDYVDGVENWNEPNKNWKGRRGLFLPYEYAAMCSADYDGHEKKLGSTLGVKNADPNLKFIMSGLISLDSAYVKAMKYWFDGNRTDKKFVPDVINFHNYCNDGNGQGSQATKGVSPEAFNLEAKTKAVVDYCKKNIPGKQVWVTEFGYDIQQSTSDQKAQPYGSYTAEQVQAMWNVRNYLAYAAAGVDRAYLYWLVDSDSDSPFKFESCGLVKNSKSTGRALRPAWYWTYTLRNTLKNYKFNSKPASGNANVMIQEYVHSTNSDSVAYVLWCPTSNSTSVASYILNIPSANSATSIVATIGSTKGTAKALTINNNSVTVKVTEDPIYVLVKKTLTNFTDNQTNNGTLIYPNPVQDELNVSALIDIESIEILDIKGALVFQQKDVNATNAKINVSQLPLGIYTIEVEYKGGKSTKSRLSIVR